MNRIPPRKPFFIHPEQTNKKLNDKKIVVQKEITSKKLYYYYYIFGEIPFFPKILENKYIVSSFFLGHFFCENWTEFQRYLYNVLASI